MPRTNFTDAQRAEIFALDRATCSYSGRSLWITDYGIDPAYAVDWADHIAPASRGGKSLVENGAAASWLYNYLRGNGRQRLVFFHRGVPTADHTLHIGTIDPRVAAQLRRFRVLHASDWFINRAMWHVWIGVASEYDRRQGLSRSRGYEYYAGAASKCLAKWRRIQEDESVASLESRHLIPPNPEKDQEKLLEVREAASHERLISMMKGLFPAFEATAKAICALSKAENAKTIMRVGAQVEGHKRIPPRIQMRLMKYADSLKRIVQ